MLHTSGKPLVSIVIPFLNAERFLPETVESVLAQTFPDWELLLVDDGSTDSSSQLAQVYASRFPEKIFYHDHPGHRNHGISASRNLGNRLARGIYIASLDADDVWLADKLQRQTTILELHPEAGMVFGRSEYWYSWTGKAEDRERDYVPDLGIPANRVYAPATLSTLLYPLGKGTPAPPSNWLIRREAIERVQGFEEQFRDAYGMYEDHAFLAKMYLHTAIFVADEVWERYRIHADSYMARTKKAGDYRTVRRFFLNWFDQYLHAQAAPYPAIRDAVAQAIVREPGPDEIERMGRWMLRCAGGSAAALVFPPDRPGLVRMEIRNVASGISFDIQLNQPRLEVLANHTYAVRFRARADSERSLRFGFAQAYAPWEGLGLYRKIELTREWQNVEESFVAVADEKNGRIHFDAGDSGISLELEAVCLLHFHERAPQGELVDPGEISLAGLSSRPVEAGQALQDAAPPAAGGVQFGSLRRLTPISRNWGFDRGTPIDRYYIRYFLARHSNDVRGRVLEVGDNSYTCEFGGNRVTHSDVLHVAEGNPQATIVADLADAPHIATGTFDCIILTQTLQLIYDVPGAIRTLHRILKPGGVLLATIPGISQTYDVEWGGDWYWGFTRLSARRLLAGEFSPGQVEIEVFGNVLTATAFLQGLAAEELTLQELSHSDPAYAVTIGARAFKKESPEIQRVANPNRVLILMYHRVAQACSDPWGLNVSPQHFAEQLDVLRTDNYFARLQDVQDMLANGRAPSQRMVVVTFDDGYADNLDPAARLLRAAGIPATIFLVARNADDRGEFWWDELDRMFLHPGTLPATLHLNLEDGPLTWDLGAAASYREEENRRDRNWRAWQDPPTSRHALYYTLWQKLRPMEEGARRQVMQTLRVWSGENRASTPAHPLLRAEELPALAGEELIEIGAHTVTHPLLRGLPLEQQRFEIFESKSRLEQILGRPVTSFAYPYGEYTQETVEIVREAGFACACSTRQSLVDPASGAFQLARFGVEDVDGEQFRRQLAAWFGD